ncbi:thiamine-phosphate kinase [Candidatus Woesearchaeota archaeon]|nr:thiamine-phosphate kinase [Candidatus Woesearchaeota archaeon]
MKIKEMSETEVIEMIRRKVKVKISNVKMGIGDDCAVLEHSKTEYLLAKTCTLVDNVHFSLEYFTPEQVGMKAVESAVSDIAAMGGRPDYCLAAIGIPHDFDSSFIDGLYGGMLSSASGYGISLIGGDVSSSPNFFISISMLGTVARKQLVTRSGARKGDMILCSGGLGGSAAGLGLLRKKAKGSSIMRHLEPKARHDLAQKLAKAGITSMTDISDGLAPEIRKLCASSGTGAVIYADKIPISSSTKNDAKKLGMNPLDIALYGGEDFELVFTAAKNKLDSLRKFGVKVIGKIVDKKNGIKLLDKNRLQALESGFDHFRSSLK